MRKVLGIEEQMMNNINNRLSSGTNGAYHQGMVLDALQNGLVCGFNNVSLLDFDVSGGALLDTTVVTAVVALTYPIGTQHFYKLSGLSSGVLKLGISANTDGGVPATTGIFPASDSTSFTKTRGVLRAQLGDVNDASTVTLDQDGQLWLPVASVQDWEVHFGVANLENVDQAATVGFVQFGVCSAAVDDDPANDPATYFAAVQIAAGKATPLTETTTLNGVAINAATEEYDFGIRYSAANGAFYFSMNGNPIGSVDGKIAAHASMTGAQVFVRVSHLAAYLAAANAPLQAEFDYITANTFLME